MKHFLVPQNNFFGEGGWLSDFDGMLSPFVNENTLLRTDVKEYAEHYLFEIEVPGISKNNLDISVDNGYLTVSSTKTDKNDGTIDDWKYIKRERSVSASRSFYIGDVNENDIKATYTDGLLYVNVPRKDVNGTTSTAKKIEIH